MLDDIAFRDPEKLKEGCGDSLPPDAKRPSGEKFYRFVERGFAKDNPDDISQAFLAWEDENVGNTNHDPCEGRAVSLYHPEGKAEATLRFFRDERGYAKFINKTIWAVTLTDEAGAIQFGPDEKRQSEGHYNWWPARDFKIEDHIS